MRGRRGCCRPRGRAPSPSRARRRAAAPRRSASSASPSSLFAARSAPAVTSPAVARVPLLAGSGVAVLNVPDDAVVLRPPLPGQVVADVAAAVREALRYPLEGPPLEDIVRGASRVT